MSINKKSAINTTFQEFFTKVPYEGRSLLMSDFEVRVSMGGPGERYLTEELKLEMGNYCGRCMISW